MSDVLIELENVGIAFDAQRRVGGNRFWALEDVSVTLRRGERLGVIGRNGAGKSTLLRVIAGILTPDRGRVRRAPVSCQLLSLALGFTPHLSGRDNAILSGLMLGLRRRDIVARLSAIRDFCELGAFFERIRLAEKVVHAGIDAAAAVIYRVVGGQRDDRYAPAGALALPDQSGRRKAVHDGHAQIHQNQIEAFRSASRDGFAPYSAPTP